MLLICTIGANMWRVFNPRSQQSLVTSNWKFNEERFPGYPFSDPVPHNNEKDPKDTFEISGSNSDHSIDFEKHAEQVKNYADSNSLPKIPFEVLSFENVPMSPQV